MSDAENTTREKIAKVLAKVYGDEDLFEDVPAGRAFDEPELQSRFEGFYNDSRERRKVPFLAGADALIAAFPTLTGSEGSEKLSAKLEATEPTDGIREQAIQILARMGNEFAGWNYSATLMVDRLIDHGLLAEAAVVPGGTPTAREDAVQ